MVSRICPKPGCGTPVQGSRTGKSWLCPACGVRYGMGAFEPELAMNDELAREMTRPPRYRPALTRRILYANYYAERHMPPPHEWLNDYLRLGTVPFSVPFAEARWVTLLLTRVLSRQPIHRDPRPPTWDHTACSYVLRYVEPGRIAALWQAGMDAER